VIKEYFGLTLRILLKNKLFSALNILSLSIGMATCLVIYLFVQYEMNFDTQYQDSNRIYRIQRDFFGDENSTLSLATTAPLVAPLLKQDFPEVQEVTRLRIEQAPMSKDDIVLLEKYIGWVDHNFFEFFDFEFIRGTSATAFDGPTSVVLSQSAAKRYFGDANPIGGTLLLNGEAILQVSGVFKDFPDNTHLRMDILLSIDLVEPMIGEGQLQSWGANSYFTYFKVPENYEIDNLVQKLPGFLATHYDADASKNTSLPIVKLTDIHLTSHAQNEITENGDADVVTTFSIIAAFVLLVACINFTNLSTARSVRRAKEIGVRKAVGAKKSDLVFQFLIESVILAFIAMLVAGALVELVIPFFSNYLGRELGFSQLYKPASLLTLVGFTILVGITAGLYPAFYLARFKPVQALKSTIPGGASSGLVRKLLVVVQFAISICLIISTVVVFQQVKYTKSIDLGYARQNTQIVELPHGVDLWSSYDPIKNELNDHPSIESVTLSSRFPTNQLLDGSAYFRANAPISEENTLSMRDVRVDYEFFEQYEIELLAGRYFNEEFNDRNIVLPTDEDPNGFANIIVNESALKSLGFNSPQEAIGQEAVQPMNDELTAFIRYPIVGVVKDFYFSSLHSNVQAIVFTPMTEDTGKYISIKATPGQQEIAKDHIRGIWKTFFPEHVFSPVDLEGEYSWLYRAEEQQATLLLFFSLLTILVAVMGLYGLAAYSTERRSKELSIRKVLGARASEILMVVSQEFIKLLLISVLIAWPIAYWLMSSWLGQFAYSISLGLGPFIVATGIALIITLLTTTSQTIRLATGRPVKYLRMD